MGSLTPRPKLIGTVLWWSGVEVTSGLVMTVAEVGCSSLPGSRPSPVSYLLMNSGPERWVGHGLWMRRRPSMNVKWYQNRSRWKKNSAHPRRTIMSQVRLDPKRCGKNLDLPRWSSNNHLYRFQEKNRMEVPRNWNHAPLPIKYTNYEPDKHDYTRGERKKNPSLIMHWKNCTLEHEEESQWCWIQADWDLQGWNRVLQLCW